MQFKNSRHRRSRWFAVAGLILVLSLLASAEPAQDMQNMPGMSMKKSSPQKKHAATGKKKPARKHNMANMPGMNMSGMHKHARQRKRTARKRRPAGKHQMGNMPEMNMPGMKRPATETSPTAKPSSQKMDMPGMNMPQANPSPSSSPQKTEMNMPSMQMPAASPNPQASPPQQMQMNMPGMNTPMPQASPSPGAMQNMPGMENSQGMGSMNMGPLMVMRGDEMAVRIGDSEANVMDLGQMGSGTSWQPDTSPSYMMDKQAGKWLLMFHFNAIVGVNAQGGPRGVTKFESANWFMPMAFHKLGKGTVQLRGMFSFEPFTFARGGSPLLFPPHCRITFKTPRTSVSVS